jgi:BRCT domain type II-containing protein
LSKNKTFEIPAPTGVHFAKEGNRWVSFDTPKDDDVNFPTLTSATTPIQISTTLATPSTSTPLFYVIEDPREARRLARLHRLKEAGFVMEPITKSTAKTTTVSTTTPSFLDDFELPEVTDKIAAFALSNGAKLKDYQWFGVYDHCSQVEN